ncbi:hypothetical protein EX895_004483 [Sporisorium graminicola]|uniref:Uncharacterized protein n=1 Tax=Sporisorium graminicola TaxID=280036 RepID=A0A4U7KPQ7_9BASI|nr:hypothetical protein EX895_004483 [Sporisorium graminicola]TKY86334.1 hypothetical protein EX895_004483 [Sporisorium graminicola]
MSDDAAAHGADGHHTGDHTVTPNEAQQPLLADTDHDIHNHVAEHSGNSSNTANKDNREDWHWLESWSSRRASTLSFHPCSSSDPVRWPSDWAGRAFDDLAGTTVRESAKRRRDTVDLVMSIAEDKPFYTRTAKACSPSSSDRQGLDTQDRSIFQSRKLLQAVQQLAWAAASNSKTNITPEQILQALHLNNTRIVKESHEHRQKRDNNRAFVLETTIMDVQRFVQALVAISHGLEQPAKNFLNRAVVHHLLTLQEISSDGSTGSTHSPFDLVRRDLPGRGTALSAVGHRNYCGATRLQYTNRPIDLYVLHEVYGEHELDITMNIERGLNIITLAHLSPNQNHSPEKTACRLPQSSETKSPWDWLTQELDTILYQITWRLEEERVAWAGTYRYEPDLASNSATNSSSSNFDWVEVDVDMEERVPWITRIEYALAGRRLSSSTQVRFKAGKATPAEPAGPVSVLKKYNVGGTADFFAGWTCKYGDHQLAECYRPRMGEDDSKCVCTDYRTDEVSSYRVGLWPVDGQNTTNVYHIPRAAIRLDGNSYMDQGVGGCPALFRADEEQYVPEMEAFGYKLKFTEPVRHKNGTILDEAELRWVEKGLKMKRIRQPKGKWY